MGTNTLSRYIHQENSRSTQEHYKGFSLVSEIKRLSLAGSFWSIEIRDQYNVTVHTLLEESYLLGTDKAKKLIDDIKTFTF